MTKAYSKEGVIKDGTTSATVGVTQMKNDFKNKISNTPLAQESSGQTKNLALNLNRIKENYKITFVVDDEIADKLDNAGSTKEDLKDKIITIFKSQNLVTIEYGNDTRTGFLMALNIDEKSKNDASHYKIQTNLIVSEDMTA